MANPCQASIEAYVERIKFVEKRLNTTLQELSIAQSKLWGATQKDFPTPEFPELKIDHDFKNNYNLESGKEIRRLNNKLEKQLGINIANISFNMEPDYWEEYGKPTKSFDLCEKAPHLCIETWVWDGVSYGKTLPEHFQKNKYWESDEKKDLARRIKARAVDGKYEAWKGWFSDSRLVGEQKTDKELIEMGYTFRWNDRIKDIYPISGAVSNTIQSLIIKNDDLKKNHEIKANELVELNSKFSQNYNSVVTERDGLKVENAKLNVTNKTLENEKASLVASKQKLENEKNSLKQLNESFKGDKERLVGENQRLISLLEEFNSLPENPSTQKVFPYVNWGEANPSQAWYKDIDWSAVPFKKLSEVEINGLDWSKINYTQAQNSSSFNITALAWDQINELSEKSKKKVYNKIDWSKIKFNSMTTGASDVFDWSFVDMKNIPSSPGFTLDVVEIDEIKGTKNFKQLCKVLKKESSSSNGYLAGASDKTLQDIGYENFVGKITDKKMQEFTTNNGDKYTLVMKPLSYERANAVAKAMGGRLAAIDGNESNSFVDKLTGILAQKSVSNNLSQTEANDVSAAWFGYSATDNTSAYTPIKLAELASSGVEDLANAYNTNSLWFIVET